VDAAIDILCEALHSRPHCSYVFTVPLLMTNIWSKTLLKAVDVYFLLKPVCAIWDHSQHDPLGIFISLPLSRHESWRLRNTQPVVDLARALREVPDDDLVQKGHILHEFLYLTRQLETMSESVVLGWLHTTEGGRFTVRLPKDEECNILVNEEYKLHVAVAQPVDHLYCPLQYELCQFRNIQGRSYNMGLRPLYDIELMKSLRRDNLDDFWSRDATTLSQNLGRIKRSLNSAHEMGMANPPIPKRRPWNLEDEFGAGAAAILARHSMDPGITEDTVQYETV
jgi:hypothetical protein